MTIKTSDSLKQATVAVIVPTIGRDTLDQCLQALNKQTRRPDEIIVVDDVERKGGSWARNEGIARSTSELIATTDDDCVPPDHWLEHLITVMDRYQADVVGGTQQERDPFLHAIRQRRNFPQVIQEDIAGHVGNSANILYKRSVLDACLRQDGHIFNGLGQDIELIGRLHQMGAKIIYTPQTVLHLRKFKAIAFLRHQFGRGQTIACLYRFYSQAKGDFPTQPSLLWGNETTGKKRSWLTAIWLKVIGPFDVSSFASTRDFMMFWLGEKFRALGFLWGILFKGKR